MDKTAFLQDAGKNIKTWWKGLDPTMQKTMMGAGVGGALGLGSSMFKDKEDRQPWHSALMGGLAGGAIGGGIGLAQKARGNLPTSAGGATADKTTFTHPKTGKVYRFKPGTPPEVMARMAEMDHSQRGIQGPGMRALEATGKVIGEGVMSPEGAAVGTGAAGIGIGKALATKETPYANRWAEKLRQFAKKPFSAFGGLSAAESTNPEHLRKGIMRADESFYKKHGIIGEEPISEVSKSRSKSYPAADPSDANITRSSSTRTGTRKWNHGQVLSELVDPANKKLLDAAARGDRIAIAQLGRRGITPDMLAALKQVGVDSEVGASLLKRLNPNHVHGVRRSLLGAIGERFGIKALGPKHITRGTLRSRIGRGGKYGLALGGLALGTNYLKNVLRRSGESSDLEKLIQQHAQQVAKP